MKSKLTIDPEQSSGVVDLFLVLGQSNAQGHVAGRSKAANEPVPGAMDVSFGDVVPLRDPVGTALGASAWPAFARAYRARTGRVVAVANAAYGASALIARCDAGMGNWSRTGRLRAVAHSACARGVRALTNRGLHARLAAIIWCQGEREAAMGVDAPAYTEGMAEMIDWSRDVLGARDLPWLISTIGQDTGRAQSPFEEIRRAQHACAATVPDVHIAFDDAHTFPDRGWMSDSVHYSEAGYTAMGDALGRFAATIIG